MKEANVDGQLVQAGPDSPEVATCPACGGPVVKRKRRSGRDSFTYFYRHKQGLDDECPLRYRPVT